MYESSDSGLQGRGLKTTRSITNSQQTVQPENKNEYFMCRAANMNEEVKCHQSEATRR